MPIIFWWPFVLGWSALPRSITFLFFESVDSLEDREVESVSCRLLNLWSLGVRTGIMVTQSPVQAKVNEQKTLRSLYGKEVRAHDISERKNTERRWLLRLWFLESQYRPNTGFSKSLLYPSRKSPFIKKSLKRFCSLKSNAVSPT